MAYPFGEGVELPVVEGMMQRSRSAERSRRARVADVVDSVDGPERAGSFLCANYDRPIQVESDEYQRSLD